MKLRRGIRTARRWLTEAGRLAVLTGSGISAESGVPTFRGEGGLWEGVGIMEVASIEGFRQDPQTAWRFYIQRYAQCLSARPNAGHLALVAMEQRLLDSGGQFTLITQNIDGLHQMAGSRNVIELHGSGRRVRCERRHGARDLAPEALTAPPTCPDCGEILRPDVVFFGEPLPPGTWEAAAEACRTCDVFLTIGAGAEVYPAAGLISLAAEAGARTIEVNPQDTPAGGIVAIALRGPAGEILPQLL